MAAVSKPPFTNDVQSTTSEQSQNSEETYRHYTSSNPNIQNPSLLHLSFNQDHDGFAAGTDQGFRLYMCEPFGQRDSVQLHGIGVVEMLFRSNTIALVGGGSYPEYPPTKVMFWDNFHKRCIGELSCKAQVRAVRLRRDRVIVVLKQQIKVYDFTDLRLLHQIVTVENPNGLCEISQVSGSFMLVCPGLQKGQVRIENYTKKNTKFISAHDSGIACIALSQDEKLLATASTKGTLVRIFSTLDGGLLQEVRRGAYTADIYSLAFSPTAQWLALSSDKGTVHVFAVKGNSGMPENNSLRSGTGVDVAAPLSGSSLSFMKRVLPKYFSSECSVAQFRLPEDIQFIVAFGQEEYTIVIVGMDGSFYRCKFDPATGGEMIQLEFYNFLSPKKTF